MSEHAPRSRRVTTTSDSQRPMREQQAQKLVSWRRTLAPRHYEAA
jgi:hypothetical protein